MCSPIYFNLFLTITAATASPTHSPVSPVAGQNSTVLTDSPLLMNEIRNLRLALRNQRNENVRLQTQLCKQNLEFLSPLPVSIIVHKLADQLLSGKQGFPSDCCFFLRFLKYWKVTLVIEFLIL